MRGVSLYCLALFVLLFSEVKRVESSTTEATSLLNRAKNKVKDLITRVRQPASSAGRDDTPAAVPSSQGSSGSKLKDVLKKVTVKDKKLYFIYYVYR